MTRPEPRDRETFLRRYDEAMQRWPAGTEFTDLDSEFGTTRVYSCGPAAGPPVVLLAAYGATSAEWNALAHDLVVDHRVHGVDVPGDPGRSVAAGTALANPADLRRWLASVLDGVGVERAQLVGHSYGAWIALDFALAEPARVSALMLLDPTMCFTPMLKGYLLRATPAMMKPSGARRAALIRWETRGVPLNDQWLELTALGTDAFGLTSTVPTRIPHEVVGLRPPTTVVAAGRGRVNHARSLVKRARARSSVITTHTLPDATHYSLPMSHPQQIAEFVRAAGG